MQIRANAAALGANLTKRGYKLVTGGTDNHLVLWDLRPEVSSCLALHSVLTLTHPAFWMQCLVWSVRLSHSDCNATVVLTNRPSGDTSHGMLGTMQSILTVIDAQGINGNKMEKACDLVHITLNKNAVVGDVSALAPGGVRIGAPAMTSRGLREADFEAIADLLHEVSIAH